MPKGTVFDRAAVQVFLRKRRMNMPASSSRALINSSAGNGLAVVGNAGAGAAEAMVWVFAQVSGTASAISSTFFAKSLSTINRGLP